MLFSFISFIGSENLFKCFLSVCTVCIFKVLGHVNISGHLHPYWMMIDDYGQMIFGNLGGLNKTQCVLPKLRSSTTNSGTKAAVLLGMNRFGSLPLLSALHLLFSIETDLKRNGEDHRDSNVEVRRVDLANWALRTSPKFTTGVEYQFHQGF